MEKKITAISIIIAAVLIGGAIMFSGGSKDQKNTAPQTAGNVSIVDGKQVIVINAKGGYSPKVTAAKAGIATIFKVKTNGTFDCSSALVIPSLGYRGNLPPSGETLIDVPAQSAGASIRGLCAMGMYSFTINFN